MTHNRATNLDAARLAMEARNKARREDVAWFAETGENLTGAATRLGITAEALRCWCRRHCPEVGQQLAERDPRDPNQRPGLLAMRSRRAS